MRTAYKVIAHLIVIGVVLEAAFIGLQSSLGGDLHEHVGMELMPLLGLALLIVGYLAKIPGGAKWAGYTLIAILGQVALASLASSGTIVGGLHGANAFAVLWLAICAGRLVSVTKATGDAPTATARV
jgi:hypothetical protein